MGKRTTEKLLMYIGLLCLMLTIICLPTAAETTVVEVDMPAPVVAVTDQTQEYGVRVGCDIGVYENDDGYYLFMPSSADMGEVILRYEGSYQLYDQNDGSLYDKGEMLTFDCSSGIVSIYEYNSESDKYYRYTLNVMQGQNIASIYVTLDRGDDGLIHINSSHDAVETGSMLMVESTGRTIYSGGLNKMKGHGLTSYQATGSLNTKNSYNINLAKKAELIEGADKSKKWSLLRIRSHGDYDATGMSYPMGYYIFNSLAGDDYFNITSRYVNVYINGEYRGVYILTERMDMNGSIQITDLDDSNFSYNLNGNNDSYKRIDRSSKDDPAIQAGIEYYSYGRHADSANDTDISGGYVLEIMCGTIGECGFKTKQGMYINVKSPSYPTKAQVQYIAEYVQNFENALFSDTGYNSLGKHYSEYIDVPTYAMQALTYSFCLNWEIYRTSTYMYKDVDGSKYEKITFGPVWDFESGSNILENDKTVFGTTFAYNERQQYLWYEQFWKKADFMKYISGMNDKMKEVTSILVGETEGNRIFALTDMTENIRSSQEMNWIRWAQSGSFERTSKRMLEALEVRYNCWFKRLWNTRDFMLGAEVTSEQTDGGYLLTVEALGDVSKYQWYKLNTDDMTKGTKIEGATDKTYLAKDDGIYYCAITGKNNAYWEWASGTVFSKEHITMYTDPICQNGEKADGIFMPEPYELGEEPKSVAGLTTAREYVYVEPAQNTDETDILDENTSMTTITDDDKPYITMAAVISVASVAVVCLCIFTKKKGGKANA